MKNRNPVGIDARLQSLSLDGLDASPPEAIQVMVADANLQIETIRAADDADLVEFVPCNGWVVYQGLARIRDQSLAAGNLFCEWGSGLGVATCLAQSLGFAAHGVEIQAQLVPQARELARTYNLAAQFYAGSFKPAGAHSGVFHAPPVCTALGFDPFSVDVVFAYPWPAEERVVFEIFATLAPTGSLLLTYHGGAALRLCRKVAD